MAELVEQRAGVVEAEQRRACPRAALAKFMHVDDDRPNVAAQLLLAAKGAHPGAAALGGPREIVAEEQRDMPPVASVTSQTRTSGW